MNDEAPSTPPTVPKAAADKEAYARYQEAVRAAKAAQKKTTSQDKSLKGISGAGKAKSAAIKAAKAELKQATGHGPWHFYSRKRKTMIIGGAVGGVLLFALLAASGSGSDNYWVGVGNYSTSPVIYQVWNGDTATVVCEGELPANPHPEDILFDVETHYCDTGLDHQSVGNLFVTVLRGEMSPDVNRDSADLDTGTIDSGVWRGQTAHGSDIYIEENRVWSAPSPRTLDEAKAGQKN